jgi:hypothetical protein
MAWGAGRVNHIINMQNAIISQEVKCMCNTVLDCTGAPAYFWLLCLMYVCLVLNSSYSDSIKTTPLQHALGTTNVISALLYFTFYQPVYYHMDNTFFLLSSCEHHGCWVGVSETIGNFMTFKILTDNMKKISFTTPTSILLVTCLVGTYGWTPLMMNPLRLSSPSMVLLPLCLMGSFLWILQLSRLKLTTTPCLSFAQMIW